MEEGKMTARDLILNLEAAGLEGEQVEQYLTCWRAGQVSEQLSLLSRRREALLEQVHREEKQIGCLDYLVYQIGKHQA